MTNTLTGSLRGRIAVVTGATRGAGRGIAIELGAAGATVYCTGRSTRQTRSPINRPETIEETAEMVTAGGGVGIPVRVDHTQPTEVKALFARVREEQGDTLDILVNNVWGGDALTDWGVPFWEHSLENGLRILEQGLFTHLIATHYAAPLLIAAAQTKPARPRLIATTVDGECGPLYFNMAKNGVEKMTRLIAEDLRTHNVAAIAMGPGYMRKEKILEELALSGTDYKTQPDTHLRASESTFYVGRAVVALSGDPELMRKTGTGVHTGDAAEEYGFTDIDGTRPHWNRFFENWKAQQKTEKE